MNLTLPVKAQYFRDIQNRTKREEYRLVTDYWTKRLQRRIYENVIITLGYPRRDDTERRIALPWGGYEIKTITHPEWNNKPVKVFAIAICWDDNFLYTTDIDEAPFHIGQNVFFYGPSDRSAPKRELDEECYGTIKCYDYDSGVGQSYPADPMIGVMMNDGTMEMYWKEELIKVVDDRPYYFTARIVQRGAS